VRELRRFRVICVGLVPLMAALILPNVPAKAATVATITAIVLDVTYQTGPNNAWTKCQVGTQLGSGSRVRTAARSKVEIKFPSGSIVRLSPRTDLVLTSVGSDQCKLVSGQVLANAVKGSNLRIEGASGTAAVQGTWVLFDGAMLDVWQGEAELRTGVGVRQVGDQEQAGVRHTRVPLRTDQGIEAGTVSATITEQNLVVTYQAANGWELLATDLYAGTAIPDSGVADGFPYSHPGLGGVAEDIHSIALQDIGVSFGQAIYLAAHAALRRATEAGEDATGWGEGTEYDAGPSMYFTFNPVTEGDTFPWSFPTGVPQPWWDGLQAGNNTQSTPGTSVGQSMREARVASDLARMRTLAGQPTAGDFAIGVQSLGLTPGASAANFGALELGAAIAGAEGFDRLGRRFYGPDTRVDVVGLIHDGGSLVGSRTRVTGVYDDFYFELGGQVFSEFAGEWNTSVSEAMVWWRQDTTDIVAGRQHYLEGPVNNNSLGSLFDTITFDGVRIDSQQDGIDLSLAWLDRYDHNMVQAGEGRGWLGRVSSPVQGGQVGATVLYEGNVGTGCSFDFSYPVLPGKLDLYGEIGDDPWGQNMQTWGVYFPSLYRTSQIDLFVEYAWRDGYDSIWSALAYYDMANDWTGILDVTKVERDDPAFAVGVVKTFSTSSR